MKKRILNLILISLISLSGISAYAKAPGVETFSAVEIEEDSAVLRGAVTSNSGIKIKEYGFQYGKSGSLLSYKKFLLGKDFNYPGPINNDIIECKVSKLSSETDYHFEFYAINENGEKTVGKSQYFKTEGDNEAPEITKLKSSEGTSFYEGTEVTFSASAKDNKEIKKIYLFIDGEVVLKKSDSSIKYTTDEFEAGEYEIAAMAEDAAGNESEVEYLTITVEENIPEEEPDTYYDEEYEDEPDYSYDEPVSAPVITITTPAEEEPETPEVTEPEPAEEKDTESPVIYLFSCDTNTTVNRDEIDEITFTSYANDNIGVTQIKLFFGGVPIDSAFSSGITSTVLTSSLVLGKNEFYIIAVDAAGNEGYSSPIIITITEDEEIEEEPEEDEEVYYDEEYDTDTAEKLHKKAYNNATSYGGIKVYVNGSKLYFDVQPQIINGRTMVPLRAIFEALGAEVQWDGNLRKVSARNDNHAVELIIGEPTMNVWHLDFSGPSGWTYLDSPAVIIDGRTLVPVRAISESFNCEVEWYADKQLVSITSND